MLHISCRQASSQDIAEILMKAGGVDYLHGGMVVNSTGLGGTWDFEPDWVSSRLYGSAASVSEGAGELAPGVQMVSFFQAVQDQLGPRLESRKIPTPILVIDHMERVPAEN